MDWHRWTVSQLLFWREGTITIQLHLINCLGTEQEAQVSNRCKQHKSDQRNKWTHPRPDVAVYTSTQQGGMQQNRFSSECWSKERRMRPVRFELVEFCMLLFFCLFVFYLFVVLSKEGGKAGRTFPCSWVHTLLQTALAGGQCLLAFLLCSTSHHLQKYFCKAWHDALQAWDPYSLILGWDKERRRCHLISHFNIFYSVSRCHVLCGLKIPLQCNNKYTNLTEKNDQKIMWKCYRARKDTANSFPLAWKK